MLLGRERDASRTDEGQAANGLAGGMGGFLLSCAAFTLLFAAIAREILKRRDVRA